MTMKRIDPLVFLFAVGCLGITSCVATEASRATEAAKAASSPEGQPYGFAQLHLISYGFSLLMVFGGIVIAILFKQFIQGLSLVACGVLSAVIVWAASYYGQELGLVSVFVIVTIILGGFAGGIYYAWKYHRKDKAMTEIVKKANGELAELPLTPATVASVERIKKKIETKETK